MIARFTAWLFRSSRDPAHTLRVKLKQARQARASATARMEDARSRNDDRDYGRAYMELRQATSDCVRAEVGLLS